MHASHLPPVVVPPNRIRELREARGLGVLDVAAHFRVWPSTVSRWESGDVTIDDEVKIHLAALLSTTVPFMMGWSCGCGRKEEEAAA